jgi:hypothetical protein
MEDIKIRIEEKGYSITNGTSNINYHVDVEYIKDAILVTVVTDPDKLSKIPRTPIERLNNTDTDDN